MAIIKCKMCGGDVELAPDKTFGTCDYCGSTMTFPKVDDEQRAAAFNRGNHFRRIGEFDKALAVYERIVAEDDTDAEAHWCCALCRFGIEYVEDPATYEYIPTCHRASFDSILEDVDYLAAVEHSDGITRRQYQKDAAKIAEVQRGVLATSQNEEPYDVFICYKETDDATHERTRDSLDAQEIYYQLTEKGYRVFFSRITLEDKAGTEYEPYIFAALNSARVMIALGSKPEHFNAVWVKNEWSRFLSLMKKDRTKLLLPCYRGMDPYDLPEQLSVLQSYDMGKIGFMQDLIRGVEKVLRRDEPKAAPVVQQVVGGPNAAALVDRGNMALEDGDWEKAREYFDQALNIDSRCGGAYLGLAMVDSYCADRARYAEAYTALGSEIRENRNAGRARQFSSELAVWFSSLDLKAAEIEEQERLAQEKAAEEARIAQEKANEERKQRESERSYLSAMRQFEKARGETNRDLALNAYQRAANEFSEILDYKDCKEYLAICEKVVANIDIEIKQQRNVLDYQAACETMQIAEEKDSLRHYRIAAEKLSHIVDYKDSSELLERCKTKIEYLEKNLGEILRKKAYEEASGILDEALTAENSARAENLLRRAAEQFRNLGDFRDSVEKSTFCLSKIAEMKEQVRKEPDSDTEKAEKEHKELEERIAAERITKIVSLKSEKARLSAELPTIKGLFSGGKRKQIEARIAEIDAELAKL